MRQTWADLAYVHWAVDPERVAPLLPRGTRPDGLDGATYVGLIPFVMRGAGFGRGPAIPWAGDFLETNVRLYSVDDQGRHGVVFRSLEANRLLVSLGVFGTALLYGDGIITPAISVLSAVEGLEEVSPSFADWVIPIAVVILVLLFMVQKRGTGAVGKVFLFDASGLEGLLRIGSFVVLGFSLIGIGSLAWLLASTGRL